MYKYWSEEVKIAKNQINFHTVLEELKDSINEFEIPSTGARNGAAFKVRIVKKLREETEEKHLANIRKKSYQGAAFKDDVIEYNTAWDAARSGVSTKTLEFARKARINVNPTGVNKSIWFKMSASCKICKDHTGKDTPQSIGHILGQCAINRGIETEDPRNSVTWRHNQILEKIVDSLASELESGGYKVMADLPGHNLHYDSFPTQWLERSTELRPDLVIIPPNNAPLIIGELTSPMLANMKNWNVEKEKKYKDHLIPKMNRPASVLAFEIGSLGETTKTFNNFLTSLGLRKKFCKTLTNEVSIIAVECSRRIFDNRDNAHWSPGFAAKP
jgi:hypothetical protein